MRLHLAALVLALLIAPGASGSVVERVNANVHLGVATCSNSVCHGATQPFADSNVWQNEFSRWQEYDPHATKAYQALRSAAGQAIAARLGLGDATQAKVCLDCHTDNVAPEKRGERFHLTDGVGCEACHGGAEQWISSHASQDANHADNLARGMYPTSDPVARAELCLSCHMGTRDRMITHRIMGAGHPRLSFELDTFTWLPEVTHYEIDDDYVARKGAFNGARDWAVGQGVAAANLLELLLDPRHGNDGLFPELILFDCHACHRKMSDGRWAPRPGTGLGPGVVRLNDANLVMFRHLLAAVDRPAAQRVLENTRALHRATTVGRDETGHAARRLLAEIRGLLPQIAAAEFSADSLAPVLDSLLADAERGEFRDYAAAEQAAMAASSLVVAYESAGRLDQAQAERLGKRVEVLFAGVEDAERYDMAAFVAALRALRQALV